MESLRRLWDTFIDFRIMADVFPDLIKTGLPNTLILTVAASVIGTIVGLLLAAAVLGGNRWIAAPCRIYIHVLRGLPAILSIYLIGQGLPLAGLTVFGSNTYGYAALAIGLMEASYIGEIFRSGMQSVEENYIESARSLGLSRRRTLWLVILPIGVRRILPALTNQYILIIKATALVFLLGLTATQREIFSIAQDEVGTRASFAPLVAAGLLYLAITIPLTWVVNRWDRALRGSRRRVEGASVQPVKADLQEQGSI